MFDWAVASVTANPKKRSYLMVMKKLFAALLFLGCLIGGAVSASVILIIVSGAANTRYS